MKEYKIAVVGATGAVGQEMTKIVEERNFPIREMRLVASERSKGRVLKFKGENLSVENLSEFSFKGIDIVLSSPGASVSREYVPRAVEEGAVIIDNTSAFRMDPDVPLVVPEVNPHAIPRHRGIIANPNCSTIQLVAVLKPLHDAAQIKRLVISTYQSASGAGAPAMNELKEQTQAVLAGAKQALPLQVRSVETKVLPCQIAFNVFPHIDVFLENAYTKEEMKLVHETRKILEDDSIQITATAVRVPVFIGHSESVNIETEKRLTPDEAREILSRAPGVIVVDNPSANEYPVPISSAGRDEVFVGRIRKDESLKKGLNLWIVSDNLRKGAALNAVQIAECMGSSLAL
jgi:aspartate-semialdehyde dehydrogenase